MMSNRDRNRGFADAANANEGDKARSVQFSRDPENVVGAPDHSDQAGRQVGLRKTGDIRRAQILLTARARDRGHEAVAPPGRGGYIAGAVLAIGERLAQCGDVESQTAFFHGDVGPGSSQQVLFANDLVGV